MVIHILHEVIALCLGCREAGKSDDVGEHTEHSPCGAPSLFVPANGAPLSAFFFSMIFGFPPQAGEKKECYCTSSFLVVGPAGVEMRRR